MRGILRGLIPWPFIGSGWQSPSAADAVGGASMGAPGPQAQSRAGQEIITSRHVNQEGGSGI
jgi:hypothetical protein